MAGVMRRPRLIVLVAVAALLVALGGLLAVQRSHSSTATAEPPRPPASAASVPLPASPTGAGAPASPSPQPPTPSATPAEPPSGSNPSGPPDPAEAAAITAFGRALVRATGTGDAAALAGLLCGQLAAEQAAHPAEPDPTVFDRVSDIAVAPDGLSATATVYAYKVRRGPPARPLTLMLQRTPGGWQACRVAGE